MAESVSSGEQMPVVPAMPKPPDARIIPLDRQDPLTHAQVEQVRFGLGDTGPLAQAVLNANVPAVMKQLTIGAVSCLSSRRPNDPVIGQMVYETDTKQVRFWDGSAWVTPANASPTGSLTPFAGSSAPTGWLLCDGSSKLVADYPALYAVIGVTYGGVLGTSFNVPDLRGRSAVGAGTGSGLTPRTLAAVGGEENHLLSGAESGTSAHLHPMPHTHNTTLYETTATSNAGLASGATNRGLVPDNSTLTNLTTNTHTTVSQSAANTSNSTAADASIAHNTMHPFIVLNHIIKT